MLSHALRGALLRTDTVLCGLVALTFVPTANAASSDLEFPADGQGMQAAMWAAKAYWGADPCGGQLQVTWADLPEDANALSHWTTFSQDPYANPAENTNCLIEFNRRIVFDWPMLCSVAIHEVGHLLGRQHSDDLNHVMSEVYMRPVSGCVDAAVQAGMVEKPDVRTATVTPAAKPPKRIRGEGIRHRFTTRRFVQRAFRSRAR